MRNLGVNELQDFIHCPKLHHFKWVKNTPLLSVKARKYWQDALIQTWIDYCKFWLSSSKHDLEYLQELWKKYWITERLNLDWTNTKPAEDTPHYLAEGWTILVQAHKYFSTLYQIPAAVDMPFFWDTNDHRLTGRIDLLFYADTNKKAVVAYKLSKTLYGASKMIGYNSPEITAWWAYLKRNIAPASPIAPSIRYYVFESTKQHVIQTSRNERQIETLNNTMVNVNRAIDSNIYWEDYGFKCTNCDYKLICNKSNYISDKDKD